MYIFQLRSSCWIQMWISANVKMIPVTIWAYQCWRGVTVWSCKFLLSRPRCAWASIRLMRHRQGNSSEWICLITFSCWCLFSELTNLINVAIALNSLPHHTMHQHTVHMTSNNQTTGILLELTSQSLLSWKLISSFYKLCLSGNRQKQSELEGFLKWKVCQGKCVCKCVCPLHLLYYSTVWQTPWTSSDLSLSSRKAPLTTPNVHLGC